MKTIIISVLLSLILALFAYVKKAMTDQALILAFIFSCIITLFGGLTCFIVLCSVFLIIELVSHIKQSTRTKINSDKVLKYAKKDTASIIANVGLGTFSLIIYKLTNNTLFIIVYASLMAESLSDSLASDIGVLSKSKPLNICTLETGTPGLSGNVSILGLISAFTGSLFIAIIIMFDTFNLYYFLVIIVSSFLGSLFDSFLGTFQVKYICPSCKTITEKTTHCNKQTLYYQGFKYLNNDIVNFLSNAVTGVISFFLLFI